MEGEPDVPGGDDEDPRLFDELFRLLYPDLRRRAQQCIRGEAPGHTLQATALVHEVYLKLAPSERRYGNEQHLFAVVTKVMRQILIDHARAKRTGKRGGGIARVPLENACMLADRDSATFLDVDDALARLREHDPLRAKMFELDFFAGLTNHEIAQALNEDEQRVKYGLSLARAWLRKALAGSAASEDAE